MDSSKNIAFGAFTASNNDTPNDENEPLLALADQLSGTSLDGRKNVDVPMTPLLARLLHINQLNEYCLLALFDQFPLQRQLPLRAVCRQWQVIIEQKCRQKRSLKLFGSVRNVGRYCRDLVDLKLHEDDQLKLKPIDRDDDFIGSLTKLHQCAHLFEDITSFVYQDSHRYPVLNSISWMFPQLTSLTLDTCSSPLTTINSLPQLTSFNLHYLDRDTIISGDLSILRQLKTFSLRNYSGHNIQSLLVQLGPKLNRLMLSNVHLSSAQLATALTANPSLVISVIHLTLGDIESYNTGNSALLDIICSQFTNLVYLHCYSIDPKSLPFFAKLHHLTELHIDRFDVSVEVPQHLPPVSSVKQLHLTFYPNPTAALNLQTLFPAVSEIAIYQWDEDDLERAHEYMAQFRFTCPVTFNVTKHFECFMGRHRMAFNA